MREGSEDVSRSRHTSDAFRIDRDIGFIELGLVDASSLTLISASQRFYNWINQPRGKRIRIADILPEMDESEAHRVIEAGGVYESEGAFSSEQGQSLILSIRLTNSGDSLGSAVRLLAFDVSELRRKEEILRTVSKLLEAHKNLISDSRRTLRAILDSLPQAVFMIDASLCVTSETSKSVEAVFGREITNLPLSEVLNLSDSEMEPLELVFGGVRWHLMAEVLPTEFSVGNRVFSLRFLPIIEELRLISVTVIAEDVTEHRRILCELEQTNAENRAIVAILAAKDEFIDLIGMSQGLSTKVECLRELRIALHSLKGGFSFLDCDQFALMCHKAESNFAPSTYKTELGLHFARELNTELIGFITRHSEILQLDQNIGQPLSRRHSRLDFDSIGELYHKAEGEGATPGILSMIEELADVSLYSVLSWLERAWIKTLEQESKEGKPIVWLGDIKLAREPYKDLLHGFLHIIRNAVDHGIETPEERRKIGKDSAGSLQIKSSYSDGVYRVSFTDDGRGIDSDEIVKIARDRGLIVNHQLSRKDALMLICEPEFSSRATISELSGQGIGLDAVRCIARSYGGDVEIESEVGLGTTVTVWFNRQRYW